jgi:hypothetical protein
MIMKKALLTLVFIVMAATGLLVAQGGERLESLRIAFITKQLQLTPQEAEKFWPVYNSYDDEMRKMVRDHRQKGGSEIDLEEKILAMHKKYRPDFLKVISEQKFDKLMVAERSWRDMLQKELQRRQKNGGGGGKPPEINF